MRPDPYKKKASRIYWSKHKDELAALKAADKDKPQPTHNDSAETPLLQTDQSNDEANDISEDVPPRSQYSRRKLEDNSWRYTEETDVDEEAMLNARIQAAQDAEDMLAIVSHMKTTRKLDSTTVHSDNVYVRDRAELNPADAQERARMLEEMNAEIVYDEFCPDPRTLARAGGVQGEHAAVRVDRVKLDVADLAPNLVLPQSANADSAPQASAGDTDELDALLDEIL
ncbi:hypothetical protein GGI05_002679 [Coemansia sp. RSA 2603]|nr:hypothetical protein GGI05_002679 [Coemansia sp. RSA 2603]